jgi:hypothetical protein
MGAGLTGPLLIKRLTNAAIRKQSDTKNERTVAHLPELSSSKDTVWICLVEIMHKCLWQLVRQTFPMEIQSSPLPCVPVSDGINAQYRVLPGAQFAESRDAAELVRRQQEGRRRIRWSLHDMIAFRTMQMQEKWGVGAS